MNFTRTGDRVSFENLYFAKRHALCGLVAAECVEHRGRFLDDIINGIFALWEENAWQLPPHNTYKRDTPQLLLPDITRPILDLFACETGALLACTAYLLQEELDAVSPFLTTGSFTLYKNGLPVFVDIGVESYTGKTFSQDRYEIWTMQSGYHNLPTLMGLDEKDGAAYCATDITVSRGDDVASLSMELAGAYPLLPCADAPAPSYRRCVALHKTKNCVVVTDTTNLSDVVLNFITYEKPVLKGGLLQIGCLAAASFCGAVPFAIEVLPITDARLKKAWDHDLYRVRFTMTGSVFTMEVS